MQKNIEENGANPIGASRLYVMGLASLLIILFHWGGASTWLQRVIGMYGYLGVEIFMFISGYGIYHSLSKGGALHAFYRRRAVRMLPTCIIAGILLVEAWHIGDPYLYSYSSLYFKLAFVGLDVWYIRTQLIFYLVAPLVFAVFAKNRCNLLLMGLYSVFAVALITPGSPFHLQFHGENQFLWDTTVVWSIKRFPAFLAGMYTARCLREGHGTVNMGRLAAAFAAAFIVMTGLCHAGKLSASSCQSCEIFLFPCWYYVVLALAWTRRIVPGFARAALEWTGRYSLEIFLTHAAIFACSKALFGRSVLVFVCSCAAFLLATLLVHWLAGAVTRKIS